MTSEKITSPKTSGKTRKGAPGQRGFFFDQGRCTGCFACMVACKDWNDIPAGPAKWMRVSCKETGKFPDVSATFLAVPCFHCAVPLCRDACPVNAIAKREADGIVVVDREVCMGGEACKFACLKACPYDAPQFGPEPNPKMQKCDFCLEAWEQGKQAICVSACPTRALDAGPLGELEARHGAGREADGFSYHARVRPSIILSPR